MAQLSTQEIDAVREAPDDEYKAWTTYDQVIQDFGPIRPFINIRDAESRHIGALCQLYRDYGLTPPDNTWVGKVPRYDSARSACAAAVQGEIDNADLYQRIMSSTERPDILEVFGHLQDASQHRHLPAFRRCLERTQD
jgi:hypothetical protein